MAAKKNDTTVMVKPTKVETSIRLDKDDLVEYMAAEQEKKLLQEKKKISKSLRDLAKDDENSTEELDEAIEAAIEEQQGEDMNDFALCLSGLTGGAEVEYVVLTNYTLLDQTYDGISRRSRSKYIYYQIQYSYGGTNNDLHAVNVYYNAVNSQLRIEWTKELKALADKPVEIAREIAYLRDERDRVDNLLRNMDRLKRQIRGHLVAQTLERHVDASSGIMEMAKSMDLDQILGLGKGAPKSLGYKRSKVKKKKSAKKKK